jgi:hypothetical protein
LPHDEAVAIASKMPLHSTLCFTPPLTYAAYADIPTSYIKVLQDNTLPPWWQDRCISTIEKHRGSKIDVYELDADHCFMWSRPKEAAQITVKIVEKLRGPSKAPNGSIE